MAKATSPTAPPLAGPAFQFLLCGIPHWGYSFHYQWTWWSFPAQGSWDRRHWPPTLAKAWQRILEVYFRTDLGGGRLSWRGASGSPTRVARAVKFLFVCFFLIYWTERKGEIFYPRLTLLPKCPPRLTPEAGSSLWVSL